MNIVLSYILWNVPATKKGDSVFVLPLAVNQGPTSMVTHANAYLMNQKQW